ncbi:uncharacterized protein B0H18DRAFT_960970 [Fomitopsis serialis]|uniref:uncharacterized protein n=1 Tax=Fomitopsis serialis TaxID=139415 RepID=UPI002007DDD0|nr:uncharacterized protein B0H18DRAFT_960970 [Neoantrodia serialis]KAH9912544.1 hypothetical protein B0H18DRAFT_960970 [Neoantrodia serialis]
MADQSWIMQVTEPQPAAVDAMNAVTAVPNGFNDVTYAVSRSPLGPPLLVDPAPAVNAAPLNTAPLLAVDPTAHPLARHNPRAIAMEVKTVLAASGDPHLDLRLQKLNTVFLEALTTRSAGNNMHMTLHYLENLSDWWSLVRENEAILSQLATVQDSVSSDGLHHPAALVPLALPAVLSALEGSSPTDRHQLSRASLLPQLYTKEPDLNKIVDKSTGKNIIVTDCAVLKAVMEEAQSYARKLRASGQQQGVSGSPSTKQIFKVGHMNNNAGNSFCANRGVPVAPGL